MKQIPLFLAAIVAFAGFSLPAATESDTRPLLTLQSETLAAYRQIQALERTTDHLREKLADARAAEASAKDELRRALDDAESRRQSFEEVLAASNKAAAAAQGHVQEREQEIEKLQDHLADAERQQFELQQQIAGLREEIAFASEARTSADARLEAERERWEEALAEQNQALMEATSARTRLDHELQEANREIALVRDALAAEQQLATTRQAQLQDSMSTSDQVIRQLEQAHADALAEEQARSEARFEKAWKKIASLAEERRLLLETRDSLTSEIDDLRAAHARLDQRLAELHESHDLAGEHARGVVADLQTQLTEAEGQLAEQETLRADLASALAATQEDLALARQTNNERTDEIARLHEELASATAQLTRLEDRLTQQVQANDALAVDLAHRENEVQALHEAFANAETRLADEKASFARQTDAVVARLEAELSAARASIENLEHELAASEQRLADATEKSSLLEAELVATLDERGEFEALLEQRTEELASLRESRDIWIEQRDEAVTAFRDLSQLHQDTIARHAEKSEQQEAAFAPLRAELEAARADAVALREQIASYEAERAVAAEALAAAQQEARQAVADLERQQVAFTESAKEIESLRTLADRQASTIGNLKAGFGKERELLESEIASREQALTDATARRQKAEADAHLYRTRLHEIEQSLAFRDAETQAEIARLRERLADAPAEASLRLAEVTADRQRLAEEVAVLRDELQDLSRAAEIARVDAEIRDERPAAGPVVRSLRPHSSSIPAMEAPADWKKERTRLLQQIDQLEAELARERAREERRERETASMER